MLCTRRSFVRGAGAGMASAAMVGTLAACHKGRGDANSDAPSADAQGGQAGNEADDSAAGSSAPATDGISKLIAGMTLKQKAAQLLMPTPEGLLGVLGSDDGAADSYGGDGVTAVGEDLKQVLAQYPVGGFAIFGNNIVGADQTRTLLADLGSATKAVGANIAPLLAVDEEGGPLVARIANSGCFDVERFPNMAEVGAEGDTSVATQVGQTIGSYLHEIGFTVDCAPVADVLTNAENTVIGTRSFGSDPELVASMVSAEVEGFSGTGVASCAKHFPGHGNTAEDSHTGKAITYKTKDELEECELVPFKAAIKAGVPMIMVGHISVPEVTGDEVPATLSPVIIDGILRHELGFDGVVISDAMNMAAIGNDYHSNDAAALFFKAGGDIMLMPNSLTAAHQGILDAVADGTITEDRLDQSLRRVLALKRDCGLL